MIGLASTRELNQRRFLARVAMVFALFVVGYVAWTELRLGGNRIALTVHDYGEATASAIAAVSCALAARRSTDRHRLAWELFATSAAIWTLGDVIWSTYESVWGINAPFPSAADVGFLGSYPFAIAGILAFPTAPRRAAFRGRDLLDGGMVGLSLLFISWALGLGDVYRSSSGSSLAWISLAYPGGDIVIGSLLVLTIRRASESQRGTLLLLLGGLAANAVADSAYAFLTASGSYQSLGNVLDTGWVVGYLMIALAPLWPSAEDTVPPDDQPVSLWQMALPWGGLVLALLISVAITATGRTMDRFLTYPGAGLAVLLAVSQLMSYRDSLTLLRRSRSAEADLKERTRLLNQVIAHAPLGIARVGLDMRIMDANPRLGSLLYTPTVAILGSPIGAYLSPEEEARVVEKFKPLLAGEVDAVESDSPVHRADQSEVWLHWSVTAVRAARDRIEYFLAMFEDITARHEAEQAAVANLAGLERLNRLKSEFVSLVSHEFRTALTGIQGYSEVMSAEEVTPDEVKEFATDINTDAMRLSRMITEMLDLDRMEAGRVSLRLTEVDLNLVVSDACDRARMASQKHVIKTDLESTLPLIVGDADRLFQVAANLMTNAVKYSPAGGEVVASSRLVDGNVRIAVRDQGPGIPDEFIGKLFGRYERYEANPKQQVIGTGLGLAIARQIVEMHKGQIGVESKIGHGSEFYFTLPVRGLDLPAPGPNSAS